MYLVYNTRPSKKTYRDKASDTWLTLLPGINQLTDDIFALFQEKLEYDVSVSLQHKPDLAKADEPVSEEVVSGEPAPDALKEASEDQVFQSLLLPEGSPSVADPDQKALYSVAEGSAPEAVQEAEEAPKADGEPVAEEAPPVVAEESVKEEAPKADGKPRRRGNK